MKLIRYSQPGREKPGIIIENKCYDTSSIVNDYDEEFFANSGIRKLKTSISKMN